MESSGKDSGEFLIDQADREVRPPPAFAGWMVRLIESGAAIRSRRTAGGGSATTPRSGVRLAELKSMRLAGPV